MILLASFQDGLMTDLPRRTFSLPSLCYCQHQEGGLMEARTGLLMGLVNADFDKRLGYKTAAYENHFPTTNGKACLKIKPIQRKAKQI